MQAVRAIGVCGMVSGANPGITHCSRKFAALSQSFWPGDYPSGREYVSVVADRGFTGGFIARLAGFIAGASRIGLLPLVTFARTEEGFDTGRSTFRLTLGGSDPPAMFKTRRLLIDLNRMIAEEDARYNRKQLTFHFYAGKVDRIAERLYQWQQITRQIFQQFENDQAFRSLINLPYLDGKVLRANFLTTYLPERLDVFRTRLQIVLPSVMN
jgi:hypothetical protein